MDLGAKAYGQFAKQDRGLVHPNADRDGVLIATVRFPVNEDIRAHADLPETGQLAVDEILDIGFAHIRPIVLPGKRPPLLRDHS